MKLLLSKLLFALLAVLVFASCKKEKEQEKVLYNTPQPSAPPPSSDTTTVTIVNAKQIILGRLYWQNLVDDIFHIWVVPVSRPDLFRDTLQIKQIEVNDRGSWYRAEPLWTVGTAESLIGGTSKVVAGIGGYYYQYLSSDNLKVFVNGGVGSLETSVRITFH